MLLIKITLSILAIIGLLLSLGEMLGLFKDKDRVNFVKMIKENLECPKDHPGAKKFINDFVLNNPKYKDMNINMEEVEKFVYVGLWMGNLTNESGRSVSGLVSGSLKMKNIHGQTTESLCSFEELRIWSKETPLWKWLGWIIVAISVVLGIVLLIIEELIKKNS